MMRTLIVAIFVVTAQSLSAFAGPAYAGSFEDGVAAVDREDYEAAVEIWTPLAEGGDVAAQYNLGVMHYRGKGVPADPEQAAAWFGRASDQGHGRASFNLAFMYDRGQGIAEDDERALEFYERAAEAGDVRAKGFLGFKYQNGDGVAQDYVLAYKWLDLAARQDGDPASSDLRDTVGADHLSPDEIAAARGMAEAWLAEHDR